MLVEKYNNLIELLNLSLQMHKNQIDSCKTYLNKKKTNAEKWFELIYSILVGTQIKTKKVKFCYNRLLQDYMDLLHPNLLKKLEDFTYLRELVENSLKNNGYRFYKTKSNTIYNAILYFYNYNFELDEFLNKFKSLEKIRKKLILISGIGYKIASHWLRNIGFYIPVIDIHIKNIFYRFEVIKGINIDYTTYEAIQNQVVNRINIDNITFDLAIWFYGKNYCGNRKCRTCKFSTICKN